MVDALEKVVLGEIEGKNRAIGAYDSIVWKIRSGFLTLTFGGWALLIKGILDAGVSPEHFRDYRGLIYALLLFNLGLALGAWYIDRTYLRRKFRVILALDELTGTLVKGGGRLDGICAGHLRVAGDSDRAFDCRGYRLARTSELAVYLAAPLVMLGGVVILVLLMGS